MEMTRWIQLGHAGVVLRHETWWLVGRRTACVMARKKVETHIDVARESHFVTEGGRLA